MQTSYGCIFLKKSSVAAINITLGVPGRRADKRRQIWESMWQVARVLGDSLVRFLYVPIQNISVSGMIFCSSVFLRKNTAAPCARG